MNSKELTSLIQHVKLNETGWFKIGIKLIIKSFFGKNDNSPKQFDELFNNVLDISEFNFHKTDFRSAFDNLVTIKELEKVEKNTYCLSKDEFEKYTNTSKRYYFVENEAKLFFSDIVQSEIQVKALSIDNLWNDFIDLLIIPTITEIGAKTYEIITGSQTSEIHYENKKDFIKKYGALSSQFPKLINKFLSSGNSSVKEYLFNLLKTHFFIEATKLPENAIDKIYNLSKEQIDLKIFVDTNFLLSLIDLHDNPFNEATYALKELLNEVKNKVKSKFYVFHNTIDEFQNLIRRYKDFLVKNTLLLGHAKTLIDREEISGISKKYYQKCIEINRTIDLDEYFEPFLNNFTVTLRKYGIELQNENLDKYQPTNNMQVNDEIIAQVEYRLNKKYPNPPKSKEDQLKVEDAEKNIWDKFKHDCIIWYAVNDKRPQFIDSVKDVKQWILTVDTQFLSFDRYKTNSLNKRISLCLQPNDLVSMLYFWVPRSEKFEKAIIENFRLPFAFTDFDETAEKVSFSILTTLSRFEDAKTIDKETLTEILTNKAIRAKIKPDKSIEENAKLIKEEVFNKYQEKKKLLEKEQNENLELKNKIYKIESDLEKVNQNFNTLIENNLNSTKKQIIENIENEKTYINQRIADKQTEYETLLKLKEKAYNEVNTLSNKFFYRVFSSRNKIELEVFQRYPDFSNILVLIKELEKFKNKYASLNYEKTENLVFICENQNASYFNELDFPNIKFFGESNSAGVFIKIVANPTYFGLRDRDLLTDSEILNLKSKFKNYKILHFYCFENYLYHPDNIAELNIPEYNKDEYTSEILKQANQKRDEIISDLKNSRKSYQEFKTTENGINQEKDAMKIIIDDLSSNEIPRVLKYFSLKKGSFEKTYLNQYNLKTKALTSTSWFKNQIQKLMEL